MLVIIRDMVAHSRLTDRHVGPSRTHACERPHTDCTDGTEVGPALCSATSVADGRILGIIAPYDTDPC